MEKPKTKTIVVTATRKYVAQEKLVFEIEVPNFPMSKITMERILEDYMKTEPGDRFGDSFWEHDDNFASHSTGSVSFHVEDGEAAQ